MQIASATTELIRNGTLVWLNKFNKTIKLVLQPNLIMLPIPSCREHYLSNDLNVQDDK
jgi:hypothetical protein